MTGSPLEAGQHAGPSRHIQVRFARVGTGKPAMGLPVFNRGQ